jgi:hypothetical protein
VDTGAGGRLIGFDVEPARSWFEGKSFEFIVFTHDAAGGVNAASAARSFGPPRQAQTVGPYTVLIWSRPFKVSPWLGPGTKTKGETKRETKSSTLRLRAGRAR